MPTTTDKIEVLTHASDGGATPDTWTTTAYPLTAAGLREAQAQCDDDAEQSAAFGPHYCGYIRSYIRIQGIDMGDIEGIEDAVPLPDILAAIAHMRAYPDPLVRARLEMERRHARIAAEHSPEARVELNRREQRILARRLAARHAAEDGLISPTGEISYRGQS